MTASFRFRLERVRVVRERKEKLAQRELADALSRRSDTIEQLRSADAELEHARQEQRGAVADGALSGGELLARQVFLERTEAMRRMQARELEQRDVEVARRDVEFTTAATEHEMLERLSDRRRGEHERELARREIGALDELATMRFRRSRA